MPYLGFNPQFTEAHLSFQRTTETPNLRTSSWAYNAGLNYAYPVIERFKLAGQFTYSAHKQIDNTNLVNLSTYSAGISMFYV